MSAGLNQQCGDVSTAGLGGFVPQLGAMPPMPPVAHSAARAHSAALVQSATTQALQMSPGGSAFPGGAAGPDLQLLHQQLGGAAASPLMGVAPQQNQEVAPQNQPTFLYSPPADM